MGKTFLIMFQLVSQAIELGNICGVESTYRSGYLGQSKKFSSLAHTHPVTESAYLFPQIFC